MTELTSGWRRAVTISRDDVDAAGARISGRVRPVVLSFVEPGAVDRGRLSLAHEYLQHTGSFKARGAASLAASHVAAGSMPAAGVSPDLCGANTDPHDLLTR